ncbi:MAG: hypothetical protein ACPGQS_12465 [Bradymonadia bacterium]
MRKLFLFVLLMSVGCGDDATSESKPYSIPNLTYGEYDLSSVSLDVPVDSFDLAVLAGRPNLVDKVNETFDTLAINVYFVDLGFTSGCLSVSGDQYRLPAMAEDALQEARAKGLTMEKVAVHVELLTPSRLPSMGSDYPVLGLCDSDDGRFPSFGTPAHRDALLADFEDLIELPGLTRITVGVDMNALFHAGADNEFGYDYSNYVTSYRDIYAALKAKNPDIMVGPGLDFRRFVQMTVPFAANRVLGKTECVVGQCDLGSSESDAIYEAYRLVVQPLLTAGLLTDFAPTADFVSWSVVPASADAPFDGSPSFDELDGTPNSERKRLLNEYFAPLLYVGEWMGDLPYFINQVDWTGSRGKQEKAVFLDVLLNSLSSRLPAALGWARLTDLPQDEIAGAGSSNSICSQVVRPGRPEFERSDDHCSAGLVDSNGSEASYGAGSVLDALSVGRE